MEPINPTGDPLLGDLIAARRLISKPENWTKGTLRDFRLGVPCFCAQGAIKEAVGLSRNGNNRQHLYEQYDEALGFLSELVPRSNLALPGGCVWEFNDDLNTSHADVLALFDRAITKRYKEVQEAA